MPHFSRRHDCSLLASRLADPLRRLGFVLRKGDAGRVADVLLSRGLVLSQTECLNVPDAQVVRLAKLAGIPQIVTSVSLAPMPCDSLHDSPLARATAGWINERLDDLIVQYKVVDQLAEQIVGELFEGALFARIAAQLPWKYTDSDHSRRPAYHIASYRFLRDFLAEPSGFTFSTIGDNGRFSEFHDETWEDVLRGEATTLVLSALHTITEHCVDESPSRISAFLRGLGDREAIFKFYHHQASGCSSGSLSMTQWILDSLGALSVAEVTLRFRPDHVALCRTDDPSVIRAVTETASKYPDQDSSSFANITAIEGCRREKAFDEPDVFLAAVRCAVTPHGMERLQSISTTGGHRGGMSYKAQRRLCIQISQWLQRVGEAPQYGSVLTRLFVALDAARLAEHKEWYVAIFGENLPTATFSSFNWPFFLACALSGVYECGGHPVRVLLSRTLISQDQTNGAFSRIVSGLTIHGNEATAMTGDEARLVNFTDDEIGSSLLFASHNTLFADTTELIPDFFDGR